MALANLSALRSKDPHTQVGAVVVNSKKRVIGLGYNGMPIGDDSFPWDRTGNIENTKYPYVIHAEINAILNVSQKITDSIMYVSLFPCSNCAKFLSQAGINEVVYYNDKYGKTDDTIIAKNIFRKLGIKFREMKKVNVIVKT